MSHAELVYTFLSDVAGLTAIVSDRISQAEAGREYDLPFCIFAHRQSIPMNSLDGYDGISLHSYTISVISTDPDEAARAIAALRAAFNPNNVGAITWPYKPAGWSSGDALIQGGLLREGSTDDAPDVVSDEDVATENVNLDLWITD